MQPQFNTQEIKLIIGLGNPGKEYENTYHNVGFLFIDFLNKADKPRRSLKTGTFMNQSGFFVKSALAKYRLNPENLLIVHDDSDIALGRFKLNFNRGSAGHKGVESVIQTLKTKKFWRLRIGIRFTDPNQIRRTKAGNLVLKKIKAADKKTLYAVFTDFLKEKLRKS